MNEQDKETIAQELGMIAKSLQATFDYWSDVAENAQAAERRAYGAKVLRNKEAKLGDRLARIETALTNLEGTS